MIKIISNFLFKKKREKQKEEYRLEEIDLSQVLDVDNFNEWWNDTTKDPNIYAHPEIFLRIDKLSPYHFYQYLQCHGIKNGQAFFYGKNATEAHNFMESVISDWREKIIKQNCNIS